MEWRLSFAMLRRAVTKRFNSFHRLSTPLNLRSLLRMGLSATLPFPSKSKTETDKNALLIFTRMDSFKPSTTSPGPSANSSKPPKTTSSAKTSTSSSPPPTKNDTTINSDGSSTTTTSPTRKSSVYPLSTISDKYHWKPPTTNLSTPGPASRSSMTSTKASLSSHSSRPSTKTKWHWLRTSMGKCRSTKKVWVIWRF